MSSSLLLQQCPTYLVRRTWVVLQIGGRRLYSCCFVECCFQDLFNIARNILVQFPSSFFSICFVSVQVLNHIVKLTELVLGRNCVLFYRIDQTYI